tara:strand:- start:4195 stop:4623 length:429 start_codon:yes stop_codon:yes gene_type:complete
MSSGPFDTRSFRVILTLGSHDIFEKSPFEFTEEMQALAKGSQHVVGHLKCSGPGVKDNLCTKALGGLNDRAYLFITSQATNGAYIKVSLCATHGTDSASGDWFAVLDPFESLFIPISDMQDVDIEASEGNPNVEYFVFQKRD